MLGKRRLTGLLCLLLLGGCRGGEQPAGAILRMLTGEGRQNLMPAISPDGRLVASHSQGLPPSTIWAVSSRGGAARRVTREGEPPPGGTAPRSPAWSPQGDRIVYEHAETTGSLRLLEKGAPH